MVVSVIVVLLYWIWSE